MGIKGYIKLHRELMDWEWYKEPLITRLYVHLILSANHKDNTIRGISVKRGQFLTGRKKLSFDTGISEQTIRTSLNKLKSTSYLTIKSTSQHSIIALRDYDLFQRPTSELTNNQPASNQRLTTNKNEKNEKNEKKNKYISEIINHLNVVCGTFYKTTTKKTEELINVRIKEGFSVDDFKKVIDIKFKEWSTDDKFCKFLRPETLFSNKFESYLNQLNKKKKEFVFDE